VLTNEIAIAHRHESLFRSRKNAVVFHESTAEGSNEVKFKNGDLIFFCFFFLIKQLSFSDLLDSNKNKQNIQNKKKVR
jgi:hypothetical protein